MKKKLLKLSYVITIFKAGEASHQMDMDKDCSSNNNMATNYTVNGGVKNDGVP